VCVRRYTQEEIFFHESNLIFIVLSLYLVVKKEKKLVAAGLPGSDEAYGEKHQFFIFSIHFKRHVEKYMHGGCVLGVPTRNKNSGNITS
jgi:hypothetical protein